MANTIHTLAGFSETDITPEVPCECELVGFNRADSFAKGVLHPLKAQVLIFQSDEQTCCIITIDSIGFTTGLTNRLRDGIAEKINIQREAVMVCFSHTHAAPDAAANHAAYFEFAQHKILKAVETARKNLFPIKAVWGTAENPIGVNRRSDSATMDKRIGLLKILDAETNKLKILLLRVTAHANVLSSDNYFISSDYFGTTRELLERAYGCKVLITQGASGNVKSKFRQSNADFLEIHPFEAEKIILSIEEKEAFNKESIASLHRNAEEIYKAIAVVFDEMVPKPVTKLTMVSDFYSFNADVPSIELALEIAEEAKRESNIDGTEWLKEVQRLHNDGVENQTAIKEVQFFCLNDGCLCGIPDEPMCEIALDIQKKANHHLIFFGGYTNGYEGYLADGTEYDKGGYEVLWSNLIYFRYYNRVMPLNRDTAAKLADAISQRWKNYIAAVQ